ncbi:uncharacterized protein B0H64DRAFT_369366 [Chaetomium fimeti]|uniref:Uncharacterized protein n=1 Tax=Chaetomium fimeti TaxID=1854472 RepID=A0AAE0HP37_9PEZI|nr:hypothetical protein B0H64DRAFT_369366 [Chaetomium fimeti]
MHFRVVLQAERIAGALVKSERELCISQLLRNPCFHILQQRQKWRNKRDVGKTQGLWSRIPENEAALEPVALRAAVHAAPEYADYGAVVVADGRARVAKESTVIENNLLLVVHDDCFPTGKGVSRSDFGHVVCEDATGHIRTGAFLVHSLPRCGLFKFEDFGFEEEEIQPAAKRIESTEIHPQSRAWRWWPWEVRHSPEHSILDMRNR